MIRMMIPVSDIGTAMKGEPAALQRQPSRSVETIRNEDGLPPSPQYRTEAAARQTERPSQAPKLPPPQQTACRRAEPKSNTPDPRQHPPPVAPHRSTLKYTQPVWGENKTSPETRTFKILDRKSSSCVQSPISSPLSGPWTGGA